MIKTSFLVLALILISGIAEASYKDQFRDQNAFATKVDEMPSRNQTRLDYSGTTSGYPIYIGHAAPSIADSSALWRICKATDTADGPTLIQCADDVAWTTRAAETYS